MCHFFASSACPVSLLRERWWDISDDEVTVFVLVVDHCVVVPGVREALQLTGAYLVVGNYGWTTPLILGGPGGRGNERGRGK